MSKHDEPPREHGERRRRDAGDVRTERDALGVVQIPAAAYWGAETQRALENFPVGGGPMPPRFLHALALVKAAAAEALQELGELDAARAAAIAGAAREVAAGGLAEQFPLDVFQTGSGTSTHMNMNEVLAHRANELLHKPRAADFIDAHDHVNRGQSSNDVIPTALHVAAARLLQEELLPALALLQSALEERSRAFDDVVKSGRTHLQDAAPVRMGQVFGGYARQVELAARQVQEAQQGLLELALGGTAVGTGLNAPAGFAARAIARLAHETGLAFRQAANHFEAQGSMDKIVGASGALRRLAVALAKIADDVRWMGSGPVNGLGELRLPALQPGSSIMPGKVNPVMCEMVLMVSAHVVGLDAAIVQGGLRGNFELNMSLPLLARNFLEAGGLLTRGATLFTERCIRGLQVDAARCRQAVERNPMLATALVPRVGHAKAVEIAQEAIRSGRSVREVARETGLLQEKELDALLEPRRMTQADGTEHDAD